VVEIGLSVVVCTHNRPGDLARCLEALAALETPAEIIVIDSASQPPCRSLVESFTARFPHLRYVREEQPGLSRARNRGITEATRPIVAFIDDDTAPARDWSACIVAPFEADARVGCVGGACVAEFECEGRRPSWLSDRLLQFAGLPRFGSQAREARSSAEWPFGANIALRKEALGADNPFAEYLGRQGTTLLSGEELALVEAVRADGWKIWLEPKAIVEHTVHSERCRSNYYWRRLWWAGVSRARSAEAPAILGLKLMVAAPVRLALYVLTGDRVHLYRAAETPGFLFERVRLRRNPT
jgi:glycosyltransferase involved in cell wall biosynthesis